MVMNMYIVSCRSPETQERPSMPKCRPRRSRVLYDYDAANEDELSLLADEVLNETSFVCKGPHFSFSFLQIVTVMPVEKDKDWVVARKDGQAGRVPVSYLEYIS